MDSHTDLERKFSLTAQLTMDDGSKEKLEVMESKSFQMEQFSKANGKNQNS